MRAIIKPAGIVTVITPEGDAFTLFADRGREAANLREQADELRARAFALLNRAVMYEQAADRLS